MQLSVFTVPSHNFVHFNLTVISKIPIIMLFYKWENNTQWEVGPKIRFTDFMPRDLPCRTFGILFLMELLKRKED